jgi:hypothetical protein
MDPVPAQGFSDPGFNKRIGKCENFLSLGFPTEAWKRMSNFNLQYTYISFNNYHADMAGNAWDGYLWVDGWPVTPPRMQHPPPGPDPVPQPQPPSHHQLSHHQPEQPVQPIHDPGNQVNLTQVDSKTEDCDQTSNYTGTSYDPSQLSDSDEEDDGVDDTTIKLGNGYAQCRAAREAAMAADVTDISCNSNALSTVKKKGFRVGAMDKNLGNEVLDCFKGARIEQNGNLVNQFLSSSFDP